SSLFHSLYLSLPKPAAIPLSSIATLSSLLSSCRGATPCCHPVSSSSRRRSSFSDFFVGGHSGSKSQISYDGG
ncbi:hypothetical protein LINPERHAP2_LOCUS21270, partial [Linum perenne]